MKLPKCQFFNSDRYPPVKAAAAPPPTRTQTAPSRPRRTARHGCRPCAIHHSCEGPFRIRGGRRTAPSLRSRRARRQLARRSGRNRVESRSCRIPNDPACAHTHHALGHVARSVGFVRAKHHGRSARCGQSKQLIQDVSAVVIQPCVRFVQ